MKPKESLPRRRRKNGHPKSSSVLIYLPFAIVHSYTPPCVKKNNNQTPQTKTATAKNTPLLKSFFSRLCLVFFLSVQVSNSTLSQHFALSKPICRLSLMHRRHSHPSRFCFTPERRRLSFWLHINRSVGTPNRIVKYFSSLVILYPPHPSIGPPSHVSLVSVPPVYPAPFFPPGYSLSLPFPVSCSIPYASFILIQITQSGPNLNIICCDRHPEDKLLSLWP